MALGDIIFTSGLHTKHSGGKILVGAVKAVGSQRGVGGGAKGGKVIIAPSAVIVTLHFINIS